MDQYAVARMQDFKQFQQVPPVGIIPEDLPPFQPTSEDVIPAVRHRYP
jgi:hypothetical protein